MLKPLSLLWIVALAAPALADGLSGYRCQNQCPLAGIANERRAYGEEALATSKVILADTTTRIAADLSKI